MKRVLVLKKRKSDIQRRKLLYNFLKKYFKEKVEFVLAEYSDIFLSIKPGEILVKIGGLDGEDIKNYDLIWFRSPGKKYKEFALTLAACFDFLHLDYIDTSLGKRALSGGKLINFVRLATGSLPIPQSLFYWSGNLKNDLVNIGRRLGFPLVLKRIDKHWGEGVFILKDNQALKKLSKDINDDEKFILQKFHPNNSDYRILVLDYKVGSWEKMTKSGNYYPKPVGGLTSKKFFPLSQIPKEMKKLAIKAAKRVNFQIAGVDIIQDKEKGDYFLIEINRVPAIAVDYPGDPELLAIAKFFEKRLK
jgi:hypothetical protein